MSETMSMEYFVIFCRVGRRARVGDSVVVDTLDMNRYEKTADSTTMELCLGGFVV